MGGWSRATMKRAKTVALLMNFSFLFINTFLHLSSSSIVLSYPYNRILVDFLSLDA